jgi:hypothetical protein
MRAVVAVAIQTISFAILFSVYYQIAWIDQSLGRSWKEITFWPVVFLAPVLTAFFWPRLSVAARAATFIVSAIIDCLLVFVLIGIIFHKAF